MVTSKTTEEWNAEQGIGPSTVLGGRYRVRRLLGEGGMGRVFLATDLREKRDVAVKVLTDERPIPKAEERFIREARSTEKINHPNVVAIFDIGHSPRGGLFFVMEYLEGEELADTLEREERLPWMRARDIALQVCSALQAAHEKGIVHRDLKLENCFRVERDGQPDFIKILDFGVAKLLGPDPEGSGRLTNTGATLGTPVYMAPELCRGKDIDHRVDVYALGVMLYELIAGYPPFQGEAFLDVALMHMNDPPPPLSHQVPPGTLPVGLEAAIMRALAKAREDRFPTMAAFARALRKVGKDVTYPAVVAAETSGPIVARGGTEPSLELPPIVDTPLSGGTVPAMHSHVAPIEEDLVEPSRVWRGLLGGLLGAGAVLGAVLWWQLPRADSGAETTEPSVQTSASAREEPSTPTPPDPVVDEDGDDGADHEAASTTTGPAEVEPTPAVEEPPTKAGKPGTKKKRNLSRQQVKRGLKPVKAYVSACAGKLTGGKPNEKVVVTMTIDRATGKVTKARARAEGGISSVENCVVEAVRRAKFESVGTGTHEYRHTLRL